MRFAILFLILMQTGCLYKRSGLQYEEFQPRLSIHAGVPPNAKSLGTVKADQKAAAWDICDLLVERSLLTIIDKARAMGGDALGNIRWIPGKKEGSFIPRCRRRWGFLLFPPLLLSNYFQSATVEATVYKLGPKASDK